MNSEITQNIRLYMKVLSINTSPHPKGCTDRALREVETALKSDGIEVVRLNVGTKDIRGCIGCNYCRSHGKCVFKDVVNEAAPLFAESDGLLVGSPVYYANASGQGRSFLDRLFYSTSGIFSKAMKVGAAVVSSRRAGSTTAFAEPQPLFHNFIHANSEQHILE